MKSLDSSTHVDAIAIIGMAGRFPGAGNIEAFWQNLCAGVDSISFFTEQELESASIDLGRLNGQQYVKARGILGNADQFDASFFGFSPREAEIMDPQHRFLLECAWEALEHAGYASEGYAGRTGIYAGVGLNTYWFNLYAHPEAIEALGGFQVTIANDKDFLATKVAYKLNLKGPSITVQTACSTSLVAVHLACQSLLNHECDLALAGGVRIATPEKAGYVHREGDISSPDGYCRAFDARAQGTVSGNGVGIVVVKRLADALADGDTVHAIIRGSAVNNDGALKVGYTAPSVAGQAEVVAEALGMAMVEPETISYIETHGTGTRLGDPIEIAALTEAFRTRTAKKGFCAIGSLKTNIGHLDAAAGVASLIKTVLALKHRRLPPSLHFETPNPDIDFANSPFYVNTTFSEWQVGTAPRRAGVSSFGLGGTNAHVILEEAPVVAASDPAQPWHLLVLSAKTRAALETATANLAGHIERNPDINMADLAYTLHVGRRTFHHRRMLVCRDRDDALAQLETGDPHQILLSSQDRAERPIVFMFPGGGTQYVHMGFGLYQTEPVFREQVDRCSELLRPLAGYDLRARLYPAEDRAAEAAEHLKRTTIALPALFVIEYALARLLMAWGIHPQAMIGHSLGEYVAACLAGVFSLEDALALVVLRGQLFEQLPSGAMLSISLSASDVCPMMDARLSVAATNGPSLCVVSGPVDAIDDMAKVLSEKGVGFRRVAIEVAAHSSMVTPILEQFTQFVRSLRLREPRIPYLSNLTGTWITAAEATDPQYWARHLRQTVRFTEGMQELLKEPDRILLEVGPGQTLSTLARAHMRKDAPQIVLTTVRHPLEQHPDSGFILKALGQLWLAGVAVDWPRMYAAERRQRIPLPTYPFEHRRYWVGSQKQAQNAPHRASQKKADIADWFYIPSWKRSMPPRPSESSAIMDMAGWLIFVDDGLGAGMVRRLEQEGQDVTIVRSGARFNRHADRQYTLDPQSSDDYDALFRELRSLGRIPRIVVHFWSITSEHHPGSDIAFFQHYQDVGYYSLLFLCHALDKEQITTPIQIAAISNYLHTVTDAELSYPEKITILGPCIAIPQEYPHISCQSIDVVAPAPGSQHETRLIDQLIAEIRTSSPDHVIAYRGHQRWVQTFEAVRLDNSAQKAGRIRDRGVYLITGGLGNVGLLLAEHLARTAQARLVLVGRSALPPRDDWEQWLDSHDPHDATSRKIRSVQALEELGAELLVFAADVADATQMQEVITQTYARFGALHGVIHGAAMTSDSSILSPISRIGRIESERQFQPKVYGLYVLANILRGQPLDFCVLLSSNASILGGLGMIAYSTANLFMDAFAANQTRSDDVLWISTNWDGWPREKRATQQAVMHTSIDQYAMTPAAALEAFDRIVSTATVSQVAVSSGDLLARLDLWIRHRPAPGPDEPAHADVATTLHPRPELESGYVAPRNTVEQQVAAIWQALLGIEQVGIHDNFFALGGHSLLATQLFSRIRDIFQIDLAIGVLFEQPTVAELALAIVQYEAEQTDSDMLEQMLVQLERLSEDDAQMPIVAEQQRIEE